MAAMLITYDLSDEERENDLLDYLKGIGAEMITESYADFYRRHRRKRAVNS